MNRLLPALLTAALTTTAFSHAALAEWTLDPERSQIAFVSIKAGHIGEANHFKNFSGTIGDDGQATIDIKLDSVETLIPIRNERMREMLFKTVDYSDATLSAKVESGAIEAMAPGDVMMTVAEGTLDLHGESQPLVITMQAGKLDENTVMVASRKPVIVDAEKFGLSDGVEKLREVAGLDSISKAVPVSFVLTFVQTPDGEAQGATSEQGVSDQALARYQEYRAIIEAMSEQQKEAVAALFGGSR